ncbi:hypothetical protein TD95_003188 [Thielaviopsis punctulata]|uniref:Elongator complex protein 6 n=1 Tax=Thielaviopsis punctulata TaxID=72032 RepID=A0A0F4ZDX0_9PEZI|nr:hypothetical protein TD95_003188 [Thielaviopsis punctulata]
MTSRAPPYLLTPYLSPAAHPVGSLTLVTNVLSATSNWLVVRYLQSLLPASTSRGTSEDVVPDDSTGENTAVVLVSFLRDFAFWNECAGKLGVDLTRHTREKSFLFIDGLSHLFTPSPSPQAPSPPKPYRILTSANLVDIQRDVSAAVTSLSIAAGPGGAPKNVVLIIDQLDFLLAATEGSVAETQNMIFSLREKTHASILTLAADSALLSSASTTLEKNHAAFSIALAHQADCVVSLRMLDTGVAKGVSGVMLITRGGQDGNCVELEEHEYLYYISADGGTRVFERGQ